MSLALVGCGRWGRNLARNFARLGVLSAIVEADDRAWAAVADLNAPRRDLDEVFADPRITAVAVAAPVELHAELGLAALSAGRDLYVEKPLAMTLGQAEDLRAAVDKSGRILMVGHLLQYHPAFVRLLAELRTGDLGRVLYVDAVRVSLGRLRSEEDVFRSLAPHDVSMILSVFGAEPVEVRAVGATFVSPGVQDVVGCDLLFPDGGLARIRTSWLAPIKEQRLTVVCEGGALVFDDVQDWPHKLLRTRHKIERSPLNIQSTERTYLEVEPAEPLLVECEHFIQACRNRTTPRTDITEGLAVQKVLDAVTARLTVSGDFGDLHD